MKLDAQNTDEWNRALSEAFDDLALSGFAEVVELGDDMAQRMKAAAPVDPGSTHHGRDSISADKGVDTEGPFVEVGPTLKGFWLGFAEFGTSRQAPRPFLRPAIEQAISNWGH